MSMHGTIRGKNRQQQSGVGLIEVLVAVLVVSIGFLGMAALQVAALSTNNSAMMRSMATIYTYSIVDAMRLDKSQALAGSYDKTVYADNCGSATTGNGLVAQQLENWCQQLSHNLGAAHTTSGQINCTAVSGSQHGYCTVAIKFADNRSGIGGGVDDEGITTIITKAKL